MTPEQDLTERLATAAWKANYTLFRGIDRQGLRGEIHELLDALETAPPVAGRTADYVREVEREMHELANALTAAIAARKPKGRKAA